MLSQITYWTDSTTVSRMRYIKSQGARFHTFVANRVTEIKEVSDPEIWRHVSPGTSQRCGCSSGLSAQDLVQEGRWIYGPNLLLQDEDCWKNQTLCQPPNENDPEVNDEFLESKKTSSWIHLIRVTAWVFRFVSNCRHKNEHVKVAKGPLSVEELTSAEEFWIKKAHVHVFPDDLARLAAGKEVHRSSDLSSLYPYTDEKGILRVGGSTETRANSSSSYYPQKACRCSFDLV